MLLSFLDQLADTEQQIVAVFRQRRFSKSITAGMICVYYGKGDSARCSGVPGRRCG